MVTTAHPRFLLRFQSMPVGGQWVDYFDWRHRFLQELPSQMRGAILLRAGEKDFGWGIRSRTLDAFPEIGSDEEMPYHQRLKNSRIIVADYPGTTYLEAMTANVPTVLFWDRQRWEMREEAEPYFEQLREAGILSDSPEAAAAHTAAIFANPLEWWDSKLVQDARRRFLDRFALGREDWVKVWAETLREEADLSRTAVSHSTSN
jgi:putative transferase (TIGR04331 family)